MFRSLLFSLILPALAIAQTATYPLESLSVAGTALGRETVMEMAGLKLGMPLNKAVIDEACRKLDATGFFQSINYHYGPAPRHGYALTLTVIDDKSMSDAVIDVPGADENEVWQWLTAKYPAFRHKVPGNQTAQQLLAHEIEQHLGPKLAGGPLVTRMEQSPDGRRMFVTFEPETLPRVANMTFTGNQEVKTDELTAAMDKVNAEQEYTDRRFRRYVDLNLRRVYEEHGMYRVRFPSVTAQKAGDRLVNVNVTIEEGPQYTLGDVQIVGDELPRSDMLRVANLKAGQVANWTEIQKALWEMEKPAKRTGYFEAAAVPERIFDDQQHVLNLRITVNKGPLYHFGELSIIGLSPDIDSKARRYWREHPGDPYDYDYPNDFFQAFSKVIDFRQFSKYRAIAAKKPGNIVDVTLEFVSR